MYYNAKHTIEEVVEDLGYSKIVYEEIEITSSKSADTVTIIQGDDTIHMKDTQALELLYELKRFLE